MNTPTSPNPTPDTPDLRPSPDTPADDTRDSESTHTATMPVTDRTGTEPATQQATEPEPLWLSGPAPFAIVLGILGLLVAGVTLLRELTDVTLPWTDLGPWSVVAAGLVVLVVGAIGLRSSRSRG